MSTQREWRVDVKGYPITVIGEPARKHLEQVNTEIGHMKMALYRIWHLDPEDLGSIRNAQAIAKEGLGNA